MGILDLPDVVLHLHLLPHLDFVTLCRLRLTNKLLNAGATTRIGRVADFKLDIDQAQTQDQNWIKFVTNLNPELPLTELSLQNNSEPLYDNAELNHIVDLYGFGIKKLRLRSYFLDSECQQLFLEALPNLVEFQIDSVNALGHKQGYIYLPEPRRRLELPPFFGTVKTLKFGTIQIDSVQSTDFWYAMIASATRLNYIRYPKVECLGGFPGALANLKYACIAILLLGQLTLFPEEPENRLKVVDFTNFEILDIPYETRLEPFLATCYSHGVRILNAHVEHLCFAQSTIIQHPEVFDCIKSVKDVHPDILTWLPMQNLETIMIQDFSRSRVLRTTPMPWTKLSSVHLHFDNHEIDDRQGYEELMEFFLVNPPRPDGLKELKLFFERGAYLTFPGSRCCVTHLMELRSLTKLTLVGWNPVNNEFHRLWQCFPVLKEVWLENCPSLGDFGFIGEHRSAPGFLKLKSLKKLTLGLNRMRRVTDRSFVDVFRHMKLHELHLISDKPLLLITSIGILSLLDGDFAKTIQRFPFDSWSLTGIGSQELLKIKSKFQMLIS